MSKAAATRRFNPTFVVTITPTSIETRAGAKGDYTVAENARISKEGRADQVRTVVAFGPHREKLSELLQVGRPVDLAVQHNGGSLKIMGEPLAQRA